MIARSRKVRFRWIGESDRELEGMVMESAVPVVDLIHHLKKVVSEHGKNVHVRLDSGYNNICVNYLRPTRGRGTEFVIRRRKRR